MHVDECWHCGLTRSPRSGGAERRRVTPPRAHKRSGFRTGRTRATSQLSRPPQCGIAVALGTAKSPGCGSSAVSVRFAWRVILVVHPGVSRRAPDGPAGHRDGTLPWSRPRRWGIAVVAGSGCGSGRGPVLWMPPAEAGTPGPRASRRTSLPRSHTHVRFRVAGDLARSELLREWSLADLDGLPDVVAAGPHGEVDERDQDDQGGGTLDGPVGRSRPEDRTCSDRPGEHDAHG